MNVLLHVCSPLLVVKNATGKRRLVIDLRVVNQCLPKRKFKYEGLNLVPDLCNKDDYFVTFDLKSGYHHVDIQEDCWVFRGSIRGSEDFSCSVCYLGLSTACYVFTKLLRPLVKRWRSLGLRAIIYIDDGFCAFASVADCLSHKDIIISDLSDAGFVVNVAKSMLIPSQVGSLLLILEKAGLQCPLTNYRSYWIQLLKWHLMAVFQ